MTRTFRTLLCAGVAWAGLQDAACAADVTAAQAGAAEAQVRTWLAGVLGPKVALPEQPVRLTPAGDHFDVVVPIKAPGVTAATPVQITATARPVNDGKWNIQGIRATSPITFTVETTVPPEPGQKGKPKTVTVTYTATTEGQDGQMQLDPSFDTPSTWTNATKATSVRVDGGGLVSQESKFGPTSAVTTIKPAGAGRVDVSTSATLQDYQSEFLSADSPPIQVAMRLVRADVGMNGLSRERAAQMVQIFAGGLADTLRKGSDNKSDAREAGRAAAAAMLAGLRDLASEMSLDESVEGVAVKYGDQGAAFDKVRLGFGAKAENDQLQARMDLGYEGLALPAVPPGPLSDLIPRRLALRPFVSGLSVSELSHLAAVGKKGRADPDDLARFFSNGGITAGIESMALELGGATFTGQVKLVATRPDDISGVGQIVAENFDGLMQTIRALPPEMAQALPQLSFALPTLAFAKGISRTVDGRLVWDISYKAGKILVNDVDLLAMAGGAPPAAQKKPGQKRTH